MASPSTSRQARGRSHPPGETGEPTAGGGTALDDRPRPAPAPSIVLELDPDPTKGARVWVNHHPQDPDRNGPGSDTREQQRLDLTDFAPIAEPASPSPVPASRMVRPAGTPPRFIEIGRILREPRSDGADDPVAERDQAGPWVPEEIMAASGTPGTDRGTPTLDALDWVRVFGPLGTEDRSEAEPDGPAWWTFGPPPLVSQRPPGQTAGVTDLTLLELIEVLGDDSEVPASHPGAGPRHRRHEQHAPSRRRSGSSRWRPAAAALALLAPAVAIAGGVGLTRALPGQPERGPDRAVPAGTAIPTGTTTAPSTAVGSPTDAGN